LTVVKHKVLQILVNLLRNAGEACRQAGRPDSLVTVTQGCAGGRFQVTIADNGVGVAAENLNRLFTRGFTTRKDGHGFGLHSSRLAAREMGGDLHARSAGSGLGAVFTLELPLTPAAPTIEPHSVSTNPA
jgi:signal transduction histidine kinase